MIAELTRSHESATLERFQRDPDFAADFLAGVSFDGDKSEIAHAVKRVGKAFESGFSDELH